MPDMYWLDSLNHTAEYQEEDSIAVAVNIHHRAQKEREREQRACFFIKLRKMPKMAHALIDKTRLIKLIFVWCTVAVQVLGITEVCL